MTEQFDLFTEWRVDAPLTEVWATLRAVERWPGWWRSVRRVEPLADGDPEGVGAMHRLIWQTALPYSLSLTTEVMAVEPERRIEVRAWGDVEGTGIWTLSQDAKRPAVVKYLWQVDVNRVWMKHLLPVLKPAFGWNHRKVMGIGGAGIQHYLATRGSAAPTEGEGLA